MNIKNHNKVIAAIEANPECWDQTVFHCGSRHCYAGWAQIISKGIQKFDYSYNTYADAMRFLELNKLEAEYLFSANRTLKELKDANKELDRRKENSIGRILLT